MVRVNAVSHLCSIMVVISHCALVASGLSEGASGQEEVREGLLGEAGA